MRGPHSVLNSRAKSREMVLWERKAPLKIELNSKWMTQDHYVRLNHRVNIGGGRQYGASASGNVTKHMAIFYCMGIRRWAVQLLACVAGRTQWLVSRALADSIDNHFTRFRPTLKQIDYRIGSRCDPTGILLRSRGREVWLTECDVTKDSLRCRLQMRYLIRNTQDLAHSWWLKKVWHMVWKSRILTL